MKTIIIIPCHNEEKNISKVVFDSLKYSPHVLVVDDGSTDKTPQNAKESGATILKHIINLGKGAAAKTGCDYAYEKGFDSVILIDGDGQHDPCEIPRFVEQLNQADIVFGYRKFSKNMPFVFRFGNQLINLVTKVLYGLNLKDTQNGYRAFKVNIYRKIRWKAQDYSMESEMIANVGRYKLNHKEVPIQTIYSDNYKGTTIIDGIKIVLNMFLWRLN
jgi:glycosyltransferase involved in cell wall biosynthesis